MWRGIVGAVVAAGLVACSSATDRADVTWPDRGPLRVLVVGDSLSRSLYASTEENGYRPLLLDALREDGPVRSTTAALSGANAGRVASIADVPERLNLAVIELGTNDVGDQTPLPAFRTDYEGIVSEVADESPDAALVCLGTWTAARGAEYDAVIEDVCTEHGGTYRPLADLFADQSLRGPAGQPAHGEGGLSDNFHPNDDGHAAIAERVLDALG